MARTDPRPTRDQRTQLRSWTILLAAMTDTDTPCSGGHGAEWWSDEPTEQATAQRLCNSCPIQTACLDYATEANIEHGIWGGSTPEDRGHHNHRQDAA